jgi:hypothetical protein
LPGTVLAVTPNDCSRKPIPGTEATVGKVSRLPTCTGSAVVTPLAVPGT